MTLFSFCLFLLLKQALRKDRIQTIVTRLSIFTQKNPQQNKPPKPTASPAVIPDGGVVSAFNEVILDLEYSLHKHRSFVKQILEKPVYFLKY